MLSLDGLSRRLLRHSRALDQSQRKEGGACTAAVTNRRQNGVALIRTCRVAQRGGLCSRIQWPNGHEYLLNLMNQVFKYKGFESCLTPVTGSKSSRVSKLAVNWIFRNEIIT
jgi:hypothetical protein